MSVYAYVDPTADQGEALFWSLVPIVAQQAGITEGDAFHHMRRVWSDRLKDLKPHHAVDHQGDGRSAIWRVRLTIWTGGGFENLVADTDDGRALDQDGSTVISGLPAVAAWVREMCAQAHPGLQLEGLSQDTLQSKLKSLRVSLSNQGGSCIWRLRYSVGQPAEPEAAVTAQHGSLRGVSARRAPHFPFFMAHVRVTREESARHK